MNKELEKVIDFYEEEKQRLENLIQEAVEETEYKVAHYHQKALNEVNVKLVCFKNLNDANFSKIESLNQLRKIYDTPHTLYATAELLDYFAQEKQKIDLQIAELLRRPKPPTIDGQEFDDFIFDMAENRISKFRFYLDKNDQYLYLDFEKIENQVVISIPCYKKLKRNYTLFKASIRALKGLGFKKTEDKKSLLLHFDLAGFRDAIAIKTLTSRILYDAIGYSSLGQSAYLQIIT